MSKDYYAILGVAHDANDTDLREAYRRRARELHPDHHPELDGTGFHELVTAYRILSDPRTRRLVDRGHDPAAPSTSAPTSGSASPDRSPTPHEDSQGAGLMLVHLLAGLFHIILIIAGITAGEANDDDAGPPAFGSFRDPSTGSWIAQPRCNLADPQLPSLTGTGPAGPTSVMTSCYYLSSPPGATVFTVQVSVDRTPPTFTTDRTIGRHRAYVPSSALPSPDPVADLAATAYIVQDPSTTLAVRLLTYKQPDEVSFDGIARDRARARELLPRILTSIERDLPPPG